LVRHRNRIRLIRVFIKAGTSKVDSLVRQAKRISEAEPEAMPLFARFARWVERRVGRSSTFLLAIAVVVLWAASGPIFGWSDTWQLVINTATTIVTFLMVFVIQNTQTRDTQAMQLKLDELIRVNEMARNSLINLEEMSEGDVERMKAAFTTLASTGTPVNRKAEAPGPISAK
jgi:low affinity Fe/Cu permease